MDVNFQLLENETLELEIIAFPLNFPNTLIEVVNELTTNDFTNANAKLIFIAYKKIIEKADQITLSSIYEHFGASPTEKKEMDLYYFCSDLSEKFFNPSTVLLERRIRTLKEYTKKRDLAKAMLNGLELLQESPEPTIESNLKIKELIQQELMKIDLIDFKKDSATIQKIGQDFISNLNEQLDENNTNLPKYLLSIKYPKLAQALGGGLTRSNLILIAARPAMGKTTFTLEILLDLAIRGYRVYFNSLEMSKGEIYRKLLTILTGINNYYIKLPKLLNKEQLSKVQEAIKVLDNLFFIIDDRTGVKPTDIRNNLTKYLLQNTPIDVVCVDHIGLCKFSDNTQNRVQEVAEISREFKRIAKDFDIVFLEISQLNRSLESRQDKRPLLSDLKDSGSLEEDANQVLFLYRDEYYNKESSDLGITEVNIAKNRESDKTTIKYLYASRVLSYQELEN